MNNDKGEDRDNNYDFWLKKAYQQENEGFDI
jgi:hypothetical protein